MLFICHSILKLYICDEVLTERGNKGCSSRGWMGARAGCFRQRAGRMNPKLGYDTGYPIRTGGEPRAGFPLRAGRTQGHISAFFLPAAPSTLVSYPPFHIGMICFQISIFVLLETAISSQTQAQTLL